MKNMIKVIAAKMVKATMTSAGLFGGVYLMDWFYNDVVTGYWSNVTVNVLEVLCGIIAATAMLVLCEKIGAKVKEIGDNYRKTKEMLKEYDEYVKWKSNRKEISSI